MKKRVLTVVMAVVLVLLMAVPAFAAGDPAKIQPDINPNVMGALQIDGKREIENLDGTIVYYSEGYAPEVKDDFLYVIMPLYQMDPTIHPDSGDIYCSFSLGGANSPFVARNYDNILVQEEDEDNIPTKTWALNYPLELKPDRVNGTYPLGINVRYRSGGKDYVQNFRLDVTINDEVMPEPEPDPGPIPDDGGGMGGGDGGGGSGTASQPKVIMTNYTVAPDPVYAGEVFTVTATLTNTSEKVNVKNITVNYKSVETDMMPEAGANTSYIKEIKKGESANFSFKMEARADAKAGPQKISVAVDYEDSSATAYQVEDEITVQIRQAIRLDYDPPQFPTMVYAGDSMQSTLNLFNKGKNTLYNVTVNLEIDGITPDASSFLGNMESGASKSADVYAVVGSADDPEAESALGPVSGNYVVSYEDEYGDTYEEKIPVETVIEEMVWDDSGMWEEGMGEMVEETGPAFPWWGWLIIAVGAIVVVAVVVTRVRKKKREQELLEDMDDDELI